MILNTYHSVKSFLKDAEGEEPVTVDEILDDDILQAENNYVQVSGSESFDTRP